MNLLCALGFHKWQIVQERKMFRGHPEVVEVDAVRMCKRCGKMQKEDYHCLGVNPPQHISEWFDVGTKV